MAGCLIAFIAGTWFGIALMCVFAVSGREARAEEKRSGAGEKEG